MVATSEATPASLRRQNTSKKRLVKKQLTAPSDILDAAAEAVLLRAPPKIPTYRQGDRCVVTGGHPGVVQFVGMITQLGAGLWVGVQLDEPVGNSNGRVGGRTFFGCPPRYGGFYRADDLQPEEQGEAGSFTDAAAADGGAGGGKRRNSLNGTSGSRGFMAPEVNSRGAYWYQFHYSR